MQVDQEGQGEQPTEEEKMNNSGSKVQFTLTIYANKFSHAVYCYPSIHPSICEFLDNCVYYLFNFLIFLKDGDKQDQGASSSKAKSKVKSVDLPILANTTRQLDQDVLNNFVDYEVSHNSLSVCLSSPENMWSVAINVTQLSSVQSSAFLILISNWSPIFCTLGSIDFVDMYSLYLSLGSYCL